MSKGCLNCGTENADDAKFCRRCGSGFSTEPPPPARRPMLLWVGLGALAVVMAGAAIGWLQHARSTAAPTFDSAPPPSVLAASAAATADALQAPSAAPASAPTAPRAALPVLPPASASGTVAAPPSRAPASAGDPQPRARQAATEKTDRDARAKALREKRARAAASAAKTEQARRRTEEAARARAAPTAAPAPAPAPAPPPPPRAAVTVATPAAMRGVKERCAGANPVAQGICEARQCMRREHAGEAVCQRLRAADDRRREQ